MPRQGKRPAPGAEKPAAAPPGDCPTCCSPYTADVRKPLACPGCSYAACQKCVKTYLLTSLADPGCMNCGLHWCRSFLDASLTATWRNGALRKHRAAVLLDRERSLLPETQPLVEREALRRAQEKLQRERFEAYRRAMLKMKEARDAYYTSRVSGLRPQFEGTEEEVRQRRAFVAACPDAECRGFLSAQYKCGTCLQKFCAACREPKSEDVEHECDPGTVQTIAQIAKTTRACPNCGMSIERVSGCDHMWCTSCDTGFSYTTGRRIENAHNTNPHMYERLRQLGASAGDAVQLEPEVACGGARGARWPCAHFGFATPAGREGFLMSLHHTGRHVEHLLHAHWQAAPEDGEQRRQLRVRYCLKDFDEKHFSARLEQLEKRREYVLEVRRTLESFVLIVFEFLTQLMVDRCPGTCEDRCLTILANIDELTNGPLRELSIRYFRATPRILLDLHRQPSLPRTRAHVVQLYEPQGHPALRDAKRPRPAADAASSTL